MVFTPTQPLGRALRRLALTTKQANKGFYKGTGSGSMGSHTKWGGYKIDISKVRTYKVPDLSDFPVCVLYLVPHIFLLTSHLLLSPRILPSSFILHLLASPISRIQLFIVFLSTAPFTNRHHSSSLPSSQRISSPKQVVSKVHRHYPDPIISSDGRLRVGLRD